jgi:hypothetical protein
MRLASGGLEFVKEFLWTSPGGSILLAEGSIQERFFDESPRLD